MVAGGVEDAIADHLARVRHAGVTGDVELQHVLSPRRVLDLVAGGGAEILALDDRERHPRRDDRRPGGDLAGAHRPKVVARAEPGRARDLVGGVDVLGRRPPSSRQDAVGLVGHRIANGERGLQHLQMVGRRRRGHVGVVVLVPGHRPIGEPPGPTLPRHHRPRRPRQQDGHDRESFDRGGVHGEPARLRTVQMAVQRVSRDGRKRARLASRANLACRARAAATSAPRKMIAARIACARRASESAIISRA